MADVDLNFLARQNERMLAEMSTFRGEMANFRDDMSVLTAMVTRVEDSLGLVHTEMQALHRK